MQILSGACGNLAGRWLFTKLDKRTVRANNGRFAIRRTTLLIARVHGWLLDRTTHALVVAANQRAAAKEKSDSCKRNRRSIFIFRFLNLRSSKQ